LHLSLSETKRLEEFQDALFEKLAEESHLSGVWFPSGLRLNEFSSVPIVFDECHFTGFVAGENRSSAAAFIPRSLSLSESLIYSAGVLALQKPQPFPANKRAKSFVLLETILGPVQAALLVLAIRRKFMR